MADDEQQGESSTQAQATELPPALTVLYCGVCTMPAEYCEFSGQFSACKTWWRANHPEVFGVYIPDDVTAVTTELGETTVSDDADKKSKRSGKGSKEDKKKAKQQVQVTRVNRSGRKYVTVITGLESFDVDVKKASKTFSNKFACGCSVSKNATGINEVVIQGDVLDEILEFIQETYQIDEDDIEIQEDKKGKR